MEKCWECRGKGRLPCPDCAGSGRDADRGRKCEGCGGAGKVRCWECGGSGRH